MYGRIINEALELSLPYMGVLSDGRTVSNYNLLPESVLLAEGWLPLIEDKPEYNPETQELRQIGYTVENNIITVSYEAVAITPTTEDRLVAAESVIMEILEMMMI